MTSVSIHIQPIMPGYVGRWVGSCLESNRSPMWLRCRGLWGTVSVYLTCTLDMDLQLVSFNLPKVIAINTYLGNMAAFDMDDPQAVVSPGGVGFDINCGVRRKPFSLFIFYFLQVRLLRTNLREKDVQPVKEQLAQSLFDHIPVSRWLGLS